MQVEQLAHPLCKRGRRLAARQPGPVHVHEFLGNARIGLARLVDDHRHQECRVVRHVQEPARGEVPFATEVAFGPRIRVCLRRKAE